MKFPSKSSDVDKIRKKLTYSAHSRCPCGSGLAYGKMTKSNNPVEGYWDCAAILDGTADKNVQHTARLPFTFYEIKSENQPSANGATTRP